MTLALALRRKRREAGIKPISTPVSQALHFQQPTNQVVKILDIKNAILTRNKEISSATFTMLMMPMAPVSYVNQALHLMNELNGGVHK